MQTKLSFFLREATKEKRFLFHMLKNNKNSQKKFKTLIFTIT